MIVHNEERRKIVNIEKWSANTMELEGSANTYLKMTNSYGNSAWYIMGVTGGFEYIHDDHYLHEAWKLNQQE